MTEKKITIISSHFFQVCLLLLCFFPDTLGVLARTIGAENFMPLADECVQLGMVKLTVIFKESTALRLENVFFDRTFCNARCHYVTATQM